MFSLEVVSRQEIVGAVSNLFGGVSRRGMTTIDRDGGMSNFISRLGTRYDTRLNPTHTHAQYVK